MGMKRNRATALAIGRPVVLAIAAAVLILVVLPAVLRAESGLIP